MSLSTSRISHQKKIDKWSLSQGLGSKDLKSLLIFETRYLLLYHRERDAEIGSKAPLLRILDTS